jgi:hypothetical protein
VFLLSRVEVNPGSIERVVSARNLRNRSGATIGKNGPEFQGNGAGKHQAQIATPKSRTIATSTAEYLQK